MVVEDVVGVALALETLVFGGCAVVAFGRRDRPGAVPFVGATGALAGSTATLVLAGEVGGPHSLSWAVFASLQLIFVVCWLWFAAVYTGEGGRFLARPLDGLALVPALGAVTIGYLHLSGNPIPQGPTMRDVGSLLFFTVPMVVVTAAFLASVALVLRAGTRYASTDLYRCLALSVGALAAAVVPFGSLTAVGRVGPTAASAFAVGYLVAGGAFGVATLRRSPFESVPVAEAIGRDRLVREIDDLVVVLDDEGRVVDMNPAARQAFDCSLAEAVGSPSERLPAVSGPLTAVETVEIDADDGRHVYEASVSQVTAATGRLVGHAVVLRDVTDRQTRRQRLQVLNRVLRHNLRNDMTAVMGYTNLIADERDEAGVYVERIQETADTLADLGDKAREIEGIIAATSDGAATTDADRIVRYVTAEARKRYPDADITVELSEAATVAASEDVLWPILWNLVENAVEHNDREVPRIEITVRSADADRVRIEVRDDGPGIPAHERGAITAGEERPLSHGSGLGLWAVKWGANRVGGDVAFGDREPRGTRVTVRLPAAVEAPADTLS